MTLEFIDIKWTVISKTALEETVEATLARLPMLGWQCLSVEHSGMDGADLNGLSRWPEQVLGSMKFQKDGADGEIHGLFWNAQRAAGGSKIVGGLYLKEYGHEVAEYTAACIRAFDDLRKLFNSPAVQCVVLSLEDDDEIDVAPGVLGAYRPLVWGAVLAEISQETRGVLGVEQEEDWTVARPIVDMAGPLSLRDMGDVLKASLAQVQAILNRQFGL